MIFYYITWVTIIKYYCVFSDFIIPIRIFILILIGLFIIGTIVGLIIAFTIYKQTCCKRKNLGVSNFNDHIVRK